MDSPRLEGSRPSRADLLFSSVFPPSGLAVVWPVNPHEPAAGDPPTSAGLDGRLGPAIDPDRDAARAHAWSTATRFFRLIGTGQDGTGSSRKHGRRAGNLLWSGRPHITREVQHALVYLFFGHGVALAERGEENLLDWYTSLALDHFHAAVVAAMRQSWEIEVSQHTAWQFLGQTTEQLHAAQQSYILPFSAHLAAVFEPQDGLDVSDTAGQQSFGWVVGRLSRDIVSLTAQAVPKQDVSTALSYLIISTGRQVFHLDAEVDSAGNVVPHDSATAGRVRARMMELLRQVRTVGLGGDRIGRTVADAMARLLTEFAHSHHMRVDWQMQKSVVPLLRSWVRIAYVPFMCEVLAELEIEPDEASKPTTDRCDQMALVALGTARLENLFEYVLRCSQSMGAILDVREYSIATGIEHRARHLITSIFINQVQSRLLHQGSSTSHILDYYIYIIRTFYRLDSKGVLLDRVSRPIRSYLRSRPDTVRVIISSLLANTQDLSFAMSQDCANTDRRINISTEIGKEIIHGPRPADPSRGEDVDWDNPTWTPDPVDADPEYRARSRSDDIIASLLTLYDSDDFVTELGSIFGETLLRFVPGEVRSSQTRERTVLEIFKHRIGDEKLQACEVMLHDVADSARLSGAIDKSIKKSREEQSRRTFRLPLRSKESALSLDTHVLSRFFWPALREESFKLPEPVQKAQDDFSAAFAQMKTMRELRWFNSLGLATVELQMRDWEWKGECQTWQASVIYFFGESKSARQSTEPGLGAVLTAQQVEAELEMDEPLVVNALAFWQSQDVLVEVGVGEFAVQERRPSQTGREAGNGPSGTGARPKSIQVPAISALKRPEDIWNENKELHKKYILGMLSRNMTPGMVFSMLQMIISSEDGVTFTLDMVTALLDEMVEESTVLCTGNKYIAFRPG